MRFQLLKEIQEQHRTQLLTLLTERLSRVINRQIKKTTAMMNLTAIFVPRVQPERSSSHSVEWSWSFHFFDYGYLLQDLGIKNQHSSR